ncbi:hypothetical protein MC885_009434 [Smutsia gigantea]|nr:hypothetical protein MC885_009434 [Smutsia gigantea]
MFVRKEQSASEIMDKVKISRTDIITDLEEQISELAVIIEQMNRDHQSAQKLQYFSDSILIHNCKNSSPFPRPNSISTNSPAASNVFNATVLFTPGGASRAEVAGTAPTPGLASSPVKWVSAVLRCSRTLKTRAEEMDKEYKYLKNMFHMYQDSIYDEMEDKWSKKRAEWEDKLEWEKILLQQKHKMTKKFDLESEEENKKINNYSAILENFSREKEPDFNKYTGERGRHSGQDVHVVLKLWKSGFSLDNSELRSCQDPSNAQFLESIRRGEMPAELRRLAHGGQVNLDMEDHRDEDFVKSKGTFKAFTGEGQKLGSTAPQVLNTSSPAQQAEHEAKASSAISIDESQPTTNIQIRLADGGRLVQKFNHSHRISDVRLFIVDARPAMAATSFVLMTTFPNKELADESQTLKEANLLNAIIEELHAEALVLESLNTTLRHTQMELEREKAVVGNLEKTLQAKLAEAEEKFKYTIQLLTEENIHLRQKIIAKNEDIYEERSGRLTSMTAFENDSDT